MHSDAVYIHDSIGDITMQRRRASNNGRSGFVPGDGVIVGGGSSGAATPLLLSSASPLQVGNWMLERVRAILGERCPSVRRR